MSDPVFKVGQTVVSTCHYMHQLTPGKRYVVTKYEPEYPDTNFTWPAYVTVLGDSGTPVTGHTHRFRALAAEDSPVE